VAQAELTSTTPVELAKPRRSQLTRQRVRSAWLFLTPMLIVLAAVAGWPLLRTFYFGFTNTSLADFEITSGLASATI
jgi:trehalose/maltose transport system permease protein